MSGDAGSLVAPKTRKPERVAANDQLRRAEARDCELTEACDAPKQTPLCGDVPTEAAPNEHKG